MPLHIEGSSLLINTSPCASLGDVGFHELQDPLLELERPFHPFFLWKAPLEPKGALPC